MKTNTIIPLGTAPKGFKGTIHRVDATACATTSFPALELERRLTEMGFIEGSTVEIRHEGFWKKDPIAVKVNHTMVALRRLAANAVHVRLSSEHG